MLVIWLNLLKKMYKIGDSWDYSWKIDKSIYSKFLSLSGDHNPMHTSDVFAKSNGFREKIVHGNILNCFISYFIGEIIPTKNVIIIEQKISFVKPFFINDIINLNSVVEKYVESVNFVEFNFNFYKGETMISKGYIHIKIL